MSWRKYKLGDILKRRRETVKILPNRDYKLVTIKLYHKGVILREISKGSDIKSTMSEVRKGDFILSGIDARNGAFGIVPAELDGAVVTNDFWCLDPDESLIDKDFLLFLTGTQFFDYICKQSSDGTTQRIRLQKDKFYNYEIDLPSVVDQRILVKNLKSLESKNKILSTELAHQLDLVKQLRQAFLREAMQGKLVPQDKNDEPARELLRKIKAEKEQLINEKKIRKEKEPPPIKPEEIPFEIPENWVWCRLGEVTEIKRGIGPKYSEKGIFKMLNQKCIRWYVVDSQFSKAIDTKWFKEINDNFKVRHSDVLVNSTGDGTIGRSAIADENVDGFVFDSHILRIRSTMSQKLICYHINSNFGQDLIALVKGATSTKQTELGVNNLANFIFPLPPLSEQHRIVAKVEQLMRYCNQLEQSIKQSQTQNDQLLQQVLREALQPKKQYEIKDELSLAAEG